jgi:transposase
VNHSDTCPRCLRRDVKPAAVAEDYDGSSRSSYRCPGCGWTWLTRRAAEPEPSPFVEHDDPDAWEADDDFTDYDGWGRR